MTKNKSLIGKIVGVVIILGLLIRYGAPPMGKTVLVPLDENADGYQKNIDQPPSHAVARKVGTIAAFLDAFKTPIELYGKVVDQHGDPVPGATVKLFPVDTPSGDQSKSKVTMSSDANGKFSVKGLNGFSMGVQATKDGYLYLSPLGGPSSSAMVDYGNGASEGKRFSNPVTPLTLTLQKVGPVEPMYYMEETRWRLPLDRTVRRIALDSKKGTGPHQIEFRLFSNTHIRDEEGNNAYTQFDWSFEASILGGGFIWNDSDYNFETPESGYKESIRYDHPASQPREKWKSFQNGRYFLKFADGSHARIRFDIDAGSSNRPLSMTSWLNLKPGSRNLASPENDGSGFHGGDPDQE